MPSPRQSSATISEFRRALLCSAAFGRILHNQPRSKATRLRLKSSSSFRFLRRHECALWHGPLRYALLFFASAPAFSPRLLQRLHSSQLGRVSLRGVQHCWTPCPQVCASSRAPPPPTPSSEQREGSLFSCAAAHVPPMHVCPSSFTPLAAFFPSLVGPACRALRPQSNRQLFFFAPISPRHPELPAAGRVESAG